MVKETVVDGSVIGLAREVSESRIHGRWSFHLNEQGTPQGGVISPLLANIYLHPLDEVMTERGHRITRYADDFVICCSSQKGCRTGTEISQSNLLEKDLGLTVHPEKTKIVNNMKESFVFLGMNLNQGN